MRGRSLRGRLLLGSAAAASFVWLCAGAALYLMERSHLYGQLDQTLIEQAQHVADLVEYDGHGLDLEFSKLDGSDYSAKERRAFYTLRSAGGKVLARSPSLQGEALPPAERAGVFETSRLADGVIARFHTIPFFPDREDGAVAAGRKRLLLSVGRNTAPVREALRHLLMLLAGIWGGALLVSVAVLRFVVSKGLRPATELASRIGAIDPAAAGGRIELPDAPAELAPVVRRLNDLLDRVEAALTREKSFLGAAAHELRTPLAGMRATLEVSLSRARSAPDYRRALEQCEEMSERMQARLDTLLGLARLDAEQAPLLREPVPLSALVREAFAPLRSRAARRGLELSLNLDEDLCVLVDPGMLRMVFDNVFDNAVSHAGGPGTIEIQAHVRDGIAEITATNPGGDLPPESLSHVFDRFFRGDAARSEEGGHMGLGLSLCKELVERMDGRILAFTDGGRFGLRVSLPRAQKTPFEPIEAAS